MVIEDVMIVPREYMRGGRIETNTKMITTTLVRQMDQYIKPKTKQ